MIRSVVALVAAVAVIAGWAGACKYELPTFGVSPDFRVTVDDRGRGAAGVTVKLKRELVEVAQAVTDSQGIASFRGVAPGVYFISTDPRWGAKVVVTTTEKPELGVRLKWPSFGVVTTRAMKGLVHLPTEIGGQRANWVLELLDGRTGRVLQRANLGSPPVFDFPGVAAGIYFLKFHIPGSRYSGQTAVELDSHAIYHAVHMDALWTSCGLLFADRSAVPSESVFPPAR